MIPRIHLTGPLEYRLANAALWCRSALEISARRILNGPTLPQWNWFLEVATDALQQQLRASFEIADVDRARAYLDSIVLNSSANSRVVVTHIAEKNFQADWFIPRDTHSSSIILYCHGGGYSFYPQGYASFISSFACAANLSTLVLDYRLSPEHRFPAQLEDALAAYRWLLEQDLDPGRLVLAGDSAGGNLVLALLLALRDAKLPMPARAIALSPATDFENSYPSFVRNAPYDWIEEAMMERWAGWFCSEAERADPLVSPGKADFRGLSPIYIQAGTAEIMFDSIQVLADRAKRQGADVVLESWEGMNHDFQIFAPHVPQAFDALRRVCEVITGATTKSQAAMPGRVLTGWYDSRR